MQAAAGIRDEEGLLGAWDAMWFGDDTASTSASPPVVPGSSLAPLLSAGRAWSKQQQQQQQRTRRALADPLASVLLLPVMNAPPRLQTLQLPLQQACSSSNQQLVGAANIRASSQMQQKLQQMLLMQLGSGSAAAGNSMPAPPAAPAAATVPVSQPRDVRSGNKVAAAAAAAADAEGARANQPPAAVQARSNGEHPEAAPAPFVLGTWAQRQYIMPLQRPLTVEEHSSPDTQQQQQQASKPGSASSPARPIPSKWGGNSSSGGSSGASSSRHAAGGHKSSSDASSSEAAAPSAAAAPGDDGCRHGGDRAALAVAAAAAAAVGTHENGDDAAAAALWGQAAAAGTAAATAGGSVGRQSTDDDEDAAVQQAAWRWRFARRWQAEQARPPLDPADGVGSPDGDGGMEEALQYLAACGENWHHLARGTSTDFACGGGSTMDSGGALLRGTLGTPSLLGQELLVGGDGSFSAAGSGANGSLLLSQSHAETAGLLADTGFSREVSVVGDPISRAALAPAAGAAAAAGGNGVLKRTASNGSDASSALQQQQQQQQRRRHARVPRGEATAQVTGLTKRAQQLLEAQSDINKAAAARWSEVRNAQASELWVGALLENVQVDDWGKFKWLLLRLRGRSGRQALLVRGTNYASDAQIVEQAHRQMMAACSAHDLPPETIEVVGGGIMEWRQHRDRNLHISAGYVAASSGPGGPACAAEVTSLAAVLTQQHLPMHYRVTREGGREL